jgi:hypothetical protein
MQRNTDETTRDVVVGTDRRVNNPRSPKTRTVQAAPRIVVGRRTGTRTGSPKHFDLWMADLAAKSALQRLKLDRLAESTEGDTAAGLAILRVNGVKNVWDLSRLGADNRRGLVEKLTPNQIEAVTAYLSRNRVIVDWSL